MAPSRPQVPAELWLLMFSYACMDTGKTGRSLSLVSKQFYQLSVGTGVDLQSVAICGEEEIERFVEVLGRRKNPQKRIRRLFVADRGLENTGAKRFRRLKPFAPNPGSPSIKDIMVHLDVRYLESLSIYRKVGWSDKELEHTVSALALVLPYLTTLAFDAHSSYDFITKFVGRSIIAPKLEHLRLSGYVQIPLNFDALLSQTTPSLKSLGLTELDYRFIKPLYRILHAFIRSAPSSGFPQPLSQIAVGLANLSSSTAYRCSDWSMSYGKLSKLIAVKQEQFVLPGETAKVVLLPIPERVRRSQIKGEEESRYQTSLSRWLEDH